MHAYRRDTIDPETGRSIQRLPVGVEIQVTLDTDIFGELTAIFQAGCIEEPTRRLNTIIRLPGP